MFAYATSFLSARKPLIVHILMSLLLPEDELWELDNKY